MNKNFKKSYWVFIGITLVLLAVLIWLFIELYLAQGKGDILYIYSAWISVIASILFATIVSFIVQIINDTRAINELIERKSNIRQREISELSYCASSFLSLYHDNEEYLVKKYNLKDSVVNGKININIIKNNMAAVNKNLDSATDDDLAISKNYLLMSDFIKEQYNKLVDEVQKKHKKFNDINTDLNYEVFTQDELKTLNIIPIFAKPFSANSYQYIESLLKMVRAFNLKINFTYNKWLTFATMAATIDDEVKDENPKPNI